MTDQPSTTPTNNGYRVVNEEIQGPAKQEIKYFSREAAFVRFAEWVEENPDELVDLYDPDGRRILCYDPRGILTDGEVA